MRFLADACLPRQVVDQLRADGHDVVRAAAGIDDDIVLAAALSEGRVVLTEDKDFGELAIRKDLPHAGVILARLSQLRPDIRAAKIAEVVRTHGAELAGTFTVVEAERIRFHDAGD